MKNKMEKKKLTENKQKTNFSSTIGSIISVHESSKG